MGIAFCRGIDLYFYRKFLYKIFQKATKSCRISAKPPPIIIKKPIKRRKIKENNKTMENPTSMHELLAQLIGEAAKACADTDLLDLVLKLLTATS
jgi:hypothetical protein